MASSQASEKLRGNVALTMYDHDPNTTDATAVEWVDMRDFGQFMAACMASALTGNGVTAFTLNVATDDSGTDSTALKTHAVGSAPDAVGDTLVLECTAEEIVQQSAASTKDFRYVSAVLTMHNAADEDVVTYLRSKPRFAYSGLTADVVA